MTYAYLRVSTGKQDGDNQRLGVDDFAKRRGLVIDEYIDDEGKSGTLEPEKRELGKLLKKLKQGDVLIAGEISRLGRSLFMVMRILEHCMNNGIKVYTVKDNYELGDNITSKVLAFAFGLSAEIEREMISRRTKEALAKRKAEGVQLGRKWGSKNSYTKLTKHLDFIQNELDKGTPKIQIARKINVNVATIFRAIKDGSLATQKETIETKEGKTKKEICSLLDLTIGKVQFAIKKNGIKGFLRAKEKQRPERCFSFEDVEKIRFFYSGIKNDRL